MKVAGHALYFTIIVSLIMAVLSSSLLLLAFYNRELVYHNAQSEVVQHNARAGALLLLDNQGSIFAQKGTFDLYGKGTDTVSLLIRRWGAYDVGISKARCGKNIATNVFMFGYPVPKDAPTLFLSDQARPLTLAGKTHIKGLCYLPEAGVKRGYVEGQYYNGTTLVDGNIQKSSPELPKMDSVALQSIYKLLAGKRDSTEFIPLNPNEVTNNSFKNSFSKPTRIILNQTSISGYTLIGNIAIVSDKHLTIDATSTLKNVIIIAPGVKVESNFKGSVQIFATDSIEIGSNCSLSYPSVLGLLKTNYSLKQPYILIGKQSSIDGIVFTHQENFDLVKTRITLFEKSTISGQVYASGYLDSKGVILGTTWAHKFILKTPSSMYENHVLNAEFDASKLIKGYIGSRLLNTAKSKKIIKWLD